MSNTTTVVKEFNFNVFSNIFKRKWHLLARIAGIQNYLSCKDSKFLIELEKELTTEYNSPKAGRSVLVPKVEGPMDVTWGQKNQVFSCHDSL